MEHLPWPYGVGLPPRFDDLAETVAFGRRWQAALAADRWVGVTWPEEFGGRGLGALENYVVIEELARARAPELVGRIGINLVGPTLLAHGTRRTEGALPPPDPLGRRDVVPALQRARRRQRPGLAHHPGRPGRRRLPGDRAQGLDLLRPVRRLGPVPDPLRPRRPQAPAGHHGPRSSTCTPRASCVHPLVQSTGEAEFNEVELDDVFVPDDRRVGDEGAGLERGRLHPGPRAGHQPAPAGHPRPAHRGAPAAGRVQRQLRRLAAPPAAGPGRHRGAPLPAPQLALADPALQGRGTRDPRAAPSSSTGARCPSGCTRRPWTSSVRRRRCGRGAAATRPTEPGSVVALLPGLVHLRRHQRDPAHPGGRAGARPARERRGPDEARGWRPWQQL